MDAKKLQSYIDDPDYRAYVDRLGRIGFVPRSSWEDAERLGSRQADDHEILSGAYKDISETWQGKLHGFTYGVAEGLTLGHAEKIKALAESSKNDTEYMDELDKAEEQGKYTRAYNPLAVGTGELVGTVGPALVAPGAGAAGMAARLTPMGAISTLGARVAAPMLARGGAAAVAGLAGAGALEGGLYESTRYVSHGLLDEDADLTAEGFVNAAGTGALWGGLAGGVLGGLGVGSVKLSQAAANKIDDIAEATRRSLSGALIGEADTLGKAAAKKVLSYSSDDFRSTIQRALAPPQASSSIDEIKQFANLGDDLSTKVMHNPSALDDIELDDVKNSVTKMYQDAVDNSGSLGEVSGYINNAKNSKDIARTISNELPSQTELSSFYDDLADTTNSLIKDLEAAPAGYYKKAELNKFKKWAFGLNNDARAISSNPSGQSSFDLYKRLEAYTDALDNVSAKTNIFDDVKSKLYNGMKDPALVGNTAAQANEIGISLKGYQTAVDDMKRVFGMNIGGKRILDSNKLRKGFGSKATDQQIAALRNFKQQSSSLSNGLKQSTMLPRTEKIVKNYEQGAKVADYLADVISHKNIVKSTGAKPSMLRDLAGFAIGDMIFDSMLGGMGVAYGLRKVVEPAVKGGTKMVFNNPKVMNKVVSFISKPRGELKSTIESAVNGLKTLDVLKASGSAGIAANVVADSKYEQYQALADVIRGNPQMIQQNIQQNIQGLDSIAVGLAGLTQDRYNRMASFIAEKAPETIVPDPLMPTQTIRPSLSKRNKFKRYIAAIENPQAVYSGISKGNVSTEGVEVLREIYPRSWSIFREQALESIAKGEMSRRARVKIERSLDIVRGDIVMRQQAHDPSSEGANKSGGGPGGNVAVKESMFDRAGEELSPNQSVLS